MNKITKSLLLIMALAVGFSLKAESVSAATLTKVKSGYYYDRATADGSDHHSWYWQNYTIDGEVAYCIEPNVPEGVEYPETNWEATGLPNSIKERVLLIGYYGYTYHGHQTTEYRAATQGMIWSTIIGNGAHTQFTTERWGAGSKLNISNEEAEIERLIAHHYDKPSFNGGTYTAQVGEPIVLTDTNNILSNFDVSVDGADFSISGNELTITPTKNGTINVRMVKKVDYSSNYKIFSGDGIQDMMVAGGVDPVVASVKVNAYYSSVELSKEDSETNKTPQGQASLKNALYGVYSQDGTLVTTITTDEFGNGKSDAVLSYGSYYIQEITPSEGYYLDSTRYPVTLKGQANVKINVPETVIKNRIQILKQYDYVDGNTTFLNAESGIIFEIFYPDNRKFGEITTDKHGYAEMDIPYGVWRFHQKNTNTGFEKIYDFYITVNETSEKEQYYNILNNKMSAYLQVFKTDIETGKTIALADTTFKILNTDTNQYVSQYVAGHVYDEFKTDKDGKFITYLKLEAGNYKLIEISSPINYLINKNGLPFTIGDGTHYSYTNYGAFITVYFSDQPIKGQIEVNKTGEEVVIKDGTFIYEEKPLDKVTFEIYANEDILSPDGNTLYYEKGQLVDTIVTKDGYAISKELYLGSYYIIEVKTDDSHVLDTKKYEFTLTQKDDMTPIVYHSYSALNLLKKGTLEFKKTDISTGKEIPDTKVEIFHVKEDGTFELVFTGITDKDGKIIIKDLFVGKFAIIETDPATGYKLSDEIVSFEIKENGEIVKANMTNEKIKSLIKIHKVDESGEKLSGVEIGIFNLENNLLGTYVTDENGDIEVELEYGSYYYQELKTIEGHILNDEKVFFDVTEDGAVIETTLVNVKVPNTSLSDSKVLDVVGIVLMIAGVGYLIYAKKKK